MVYNLCDGLSSVRTCFYFVNKTCMVGNTSIDTIYSLANNQTRQKFQTVHVNVPNHVLTYVEPTMTSQSLVTLATIHGQLQICKC
jgi:hypothetical protein